MAILSREDTGPRPQRPAGAAKTGLPGPASSLPGPKRRPGGFRDGSDKLFSAMLRPLSGHPFFGDLRS
ncbi:hypothetical protein CAY53_04070 [Desulfobulbus oralis]|uniref:Uncharacterized protein n=1 Tax=Desulfobulbus oralis TaxID=1986146 RepID=A0A2L1GM51_9BACT|nr:hypothetical protein CAY53_04070 [Desulfobulbus oralis]